MTSGTLDGRVALVTGASSGLGRRAAQVLHGAGATVVMAARRMDRLEELEGELETRAIAVACDIRSDDEVERLFARIDEVGPLEIVVSAAGISDAARAETQSRRDFTDVLEVNLISAFDIATHAARRMLPAGRGSIINIASIFGLVASTPVRAAAYAASKGGLINLTRELAAQWGRKGVRVNAIAPGWFPTEMNEEMFASASSVDWIKQNTVLGRAGSDGELDGAIRYLASDESSYVTGHVLVIDGGWTIR
ncbi:MAG: SDR family NAD(P)-dependent oxidoreductase [Ilumatobacteraceae bacterium]